jgi:tRNA C32,U32 (ribose-2'-O)-methylase TrmJ
MNKKEQPRIIPLKPSKEAPNYTRKHDLTIEEVKACSIFRNISDEQAQDVIETLKSLALIAYELYDNQLVMMKKSENGVTFAPEEKNHSLKSKNRAA